MSHIQVFFIGDELVAGYGDARAMGWTGRVIARTPMEPPIMPYVLSMPGEDTGQLGERWKDEVSPRMLRDADNRLVIALGSHDIDHGLSLARSRLHVANLLDNAARLGLDPFVVGPPPRLDVPEPGIARLSHAFEEVCARRHTPYVDTYTPLVTHEQWNTDMASQRGAYTPRQAGYGLMAWLVLHQGWHEWLGISAANPNSPSA